MEENVTYLELVEKLKAVDLHIKAINWKPAEKGGVLLEAEVISQKAQQPPCVNKGAIYGGIMAKGNTPDEVAQNIFTTMTTSDVLIRSSGSFTGKIVYANGIFTKEELSAKESIEFNSDY